MSEITLFILDTVSVGAFALFLCQALFLFIRGRYNKARRVLSYVYVLFSLACMMRIVGFQLHIFPSVFPYFNINTIIIGCFIIILTFLYPVEVITPGWLNKRRTVLFFLPITFVTLFYFLVLHFLDQDIQTLFSYDDFFQSLGQFNVWFRLVFILISTGYIYVLIRIIFKSERRYEKWKNEMYADREFMDISWMSHYAGFIILIYLAWLTTILFGNAWCIIAHTVIVIVSSCYLFYKAIFHESPYPEHFFDRSLNEHQAEVINEDKILLPAEDIVELNEKSFEDKIPEYVVRLKQWLDEEKPYLYKDFKLTDASRILPLNRSYLSRVFNEGFDQNFSEVIRMYRVEYAKTVLKEHPSLSLNEVAHLCGFSSDTTFIRAFNKVMDMTPKMYKDSLSHP